MNAYSPRHRAPKHRRLGPALTKAYPFKFKPKHCAGGNTCIGHQHPEPKRRAS